MAENKDLIKSSVEFKAVADKAIADKSLLEKQLRDENKEHISQISLLKKDLEEYGLLQFTRSGRIAVSKEKMGISEILNTFKNQK